MIEEYILTQNLHWQGKSLHAGTQREALKRVISFLPLDHTIAITGMRRCGKSFLLRQAINHLLQCNVKPENILFVNLEAPSFSGKPAHEILDKLYEIYHKLKQPGGRQYLFLDEVQNLQRWENWIKYQYDQNKGELKFILTGSNSHMLSSEFATLLTGRVLEQRLHPFSFREFLSHHNSLPLDRQSYVLQRPAIMRLLEEYMQFGGMPELLTIEDIESKRQLLISYFDAILYKDIIPRFSIREQALLNDLAVYLLGSSAELVNLTKVADRFRTTRNTIKEYIEYLEKAFLVTILQKFSYSHRTRLDSFKKCYAIDSGLANLLPIRFSPDRGKLLETLVCVELQRRYESVFYYRNQTECDFIVQDRDRVRNGIQVCYHLSPTNIERELAGLTEVKKLFGTQNNLLLTFEQETGLGEMPAEVSVRPVAEWLVFRDASS